MEDILIQEIEDKKRSLKRYRKNRECIRRLENKLDLLDNKITKIKGPNYSGMPRGGTPVDLADLISDKQELEDRIKRLKNKGRTMRGEILEEIDTIDNATYCDVLESFFIDCMDFDEIADLKGYNTKSVIRIYSKGIKALVDPTE